MRTAQFVGVPHASVAQGAQAVSQAFPNDPAMLIVDAITEADLHAIGKAASGKALLTGGSGMALGLPANFGMTPATPSWTGISGRGVVLSGSCSRATRRQVVAYKAAAPSREISAGDVMNGVTSAEELADWVMLHDQPPPIYSSVDPAIVAYA